MGKQPHNEHELELALTRFAGSNLAAVECRDIMAGVILGQMLPPGTVVKGGVHKAQARSREFTSDCGCRQDRNI